MIDCALLRAFPLSGLIVLAVCLGGMPQAIAADSGLNYVFGASAGFRDIDFSLSNTQAPVEELGLEGGKVDIDFEEALYTVGFFGGVIFERFYVNALVELSPEESTVLEVDAPVFAGLTDDTSRRSDIERFDIGVTLGVDVWKGLSLFSGYKFTRFDVAASEDNFVLSTKDTRYQEEGLFAGGTYVWHVGDRLSISVSAAYAFLDISFGDTELNWEDSRQAFVFSEYAFNGVARGFSVGTHWVLPVAEHWLIGGGIKFQEYDSNDNATTLTVHPRLDPTVTLATLQQSGIDTGHTDVAVNLGFQYLF